jgi:4-amino-4-deoxy-L-arabinose transferase-like glycosyltransferase
VLGLKGPSRFRTDWLLLAGFCGFLFFFGLSYFGLLGADEPRYAQVAREMLARRDWITPTLGGSAWLEKPPLYYWQAMLAYSCFGVSDWAARLPSAVDATVMVIAVYFFLRRFRPGFHVDGALMTASTAGVIGFARGASTDMPLAASLTIALLAWYAWYESKSKFHLVIFHGMLALGALAKGPVAPFLAGLVVVTFALAKRDLHLLWKTLWLPGILLFCAIVLPWYWEVQVRNPEFFRVFILEHNLERFGTNLYRHKEPFWFYVPVVLLGLVPWAAFFVAALVECLRAWWAEGREVLNSQRTLEVFLAIWFFVPLVFFSISQSKLPGYILPSIPAGALLVAEYGRRRMLDQSRPALVLTVLHSGIAAAPVVPALMIQYLVLQHRMPWGQAAVISTAFGIILAIGFVATFRSRIGMGASRFVLVPVVLAVAAALRLGSPAIDSTQSARPVAQELGRIDTRGLPLAVFRARRETEFGLAFYRNQVIARYERDAVPSGEHLVVAPEGSQTELAKQVIGRRVSYLGSYGAQALDYYWVAAASTAHQH